METMQGKVAVITGAASGIGRSLATTFASQGMKLVLADIEEQPLAELAGELEQAGAEAHGVPTDVSSADSVAALGEAVRERFGKLHVACNNAGVFAGGLCWEEPLSDYEWQIGVNLWGVIHGVRTFVPMLIEHGEEAHIVNTASMAAVTSAPFSGVYTMTKHAVLALTECLQQELALTHPQVGVSCLCPEAIRTGIGLSDRNRPSSLALPGERAPEAEMVEGGLREAVAAGLEPQVMADRVLDGIRANRFYLLGEGDWRAAAEGRMERIRRGENPGFDLAGASPEDFTSD